ncbi:hypothetical protein SK3146_01974 [Paenibacillus konkukensis]|uniref:DUF4247 domain-containing protein n=1 Tax=Paenibacillus konkukensis TaxID=2020716 RepID=A0ABY4RMZ5_9BACL|nr:DUF4247 domain-containing protein [Paenibacillus konkukensis]UQZ82814.1 hypothetical protein SK3146_01974 [Paenibacillus konkukensis]
MRTTLIGFFSRLSARLKRKFETPMEAQPAESGSLPSPRYSYPVKKRSMQLLSVMLVVALIAGCGNASNYVKDHYSLIDVQGQGKNTAKIYSVEGKDVPAVAKELASQEKPKETSKESQDQMFLVYDNKIINVQKDPDNAGNTLVELDTVEYAKEHYDSSFLEGYVAASLLQSLFGGGWFNGSRGSSDYKGYTTSKRYDDYGKYQAAPSASGSGSTSSPSTTDRKGSFSTGSKSTPSTGSTSNSGSSGSSSSSSSSSSIRKNDGSTPTYKTPSSSSKSKPSTSSRSGSFKRK